MTHSSLVQSFYSILMSVVRCHLAPIMHVLLLRHRVLKTGAEQLARMFRVSPQPLCFSTTTVFLQLPGRLHAFSLHHKDLWFIHE